MFGSGAAALELLAYLGDGLIESASGAEVVVAPDGVEETFPRERFASMSGEELEKLHLLGCQIDFSLFATHFIGSWDQ